MSVNLLLRTVRKKYQTKISFNVKRRKKSKLVRRRNVFRVALRIVRESKRYDKDGAIGISTRETISMVFYTVLRISPSIDFIYKTLRSSGGTRDR